MWPRHFEVGLVIARTANQSNKIDFRRHIWLSVADQVTASLVRAPWTGFESRTEVCPQDIDNTEIFLPFLDTYRTICLAPEPQFRHVLEELRQTRLAA